MLIDFNLWDFLPYLGLTVMGCWFFCSLMKAMYRAGQDEPLDPQEPPVRDRTYKEALRERLKDRAN